MTKILSTHLANPILALALTVTFSSYATSIRAQTVPRHTRPIPKSTGNSAKTPKDVAVPFHAGETLNYNVSWAAFKTAASVQLSVPERRNLFGWSTWHFRAAIHTNSPVRSLFAVDDEFDSYTDAFTFESRQYETYLNEMGRKQDQVLHFLPPGQTSRIPGSSVIVLPGTRDPAGALYELRTVDWKSHPTLTSNVYDGHDIYEVKANIEAADDKISVAAGTFSCSRVSVHLSQHDKDSGISFVLWLANDNARTPVQIQAVLPFGSLRVELIPAQQ